MSFLFFSSHLFAEIGQGGGNGKMTEMVASLIRIEAVTNQILSNTNIENQQKSEFKDIYLIGSESGQYNYVVEILKSDRCYAYGFLVSNEVAKYKAPYPSSVIRKDGDTHNCR